MLTKDIISIVLWIIWGIVMCLSCLGQYFINQENKKRIENK